MYCQHCGEKIPEDSKFCTHCGTKLAGSHKTDSEANSNVAKGSKRTKYASFKTRLGSYAIDLLGMMCVAIVVLIVLEYLFGESVYEWPDIFLGYLSYVVYNTILLSIWSTTLGKYLYGLKVVTENYRKLDVGTALGRSLLQPFSTFLFGVGFWNMNKNDKKQAWHDKKINTVVIREEKDLGLAFIMTIVGGALWLYLYVSGL